MSVCKVILLGNLGKDPEVRTLDNGTKVARLSLATSESYKDKNTGEKVENTEWHQVVLWKHLAEIAEKWLKKGSKLYIEGKINTRSYEDKDGITKYSTEITGYTMQMLGDKEGSSTDSTPAPESASSGSDNDLPF